MLKAIASGPHFRACLVGFRGAVCAGPSGAGVKQRALLEPCEEPLDRTGDSAGEGGERTEPGHNCSARRTDQRTSARVSMPAMKAASRCSSV